MATMNARAFLVLLAGLIASMASTLPPDPIPSDECSGGEVGVVDGLELYLGEDAAIGPASDLDTAPIVYGFQGAAMIPLTYYLKGAQVPECLATEVVIDLCVDGDACETVEMVNDVYPSIHTYEGDGVFTTEPLYVIVDYPAQPGSVVRVLVRVGALERTWILRLGSG